MISLGAFSAAQKLGAAAAVAFALLLVGALGGWHARATIADRDIAVLRAQRDALHAVQAERARQDEAQERSIEARRAQITQEISDAATIKTRQRAVAVRTAAAAGGGLRDTAKTFAATAGQAGLDPGIACDCQAAQSRAVVLANLLADVELLGREMARVADERGDAGAVCESIHDALTSREYPAQDPRKQGLEFRALFP